MMTDLNQINWDHETKPYYGSVRKINSKHTLSIAFSICSLMIMALSTRSWNAISNNNTARYLTPDKEVYNQEYYNILGNAKDVPGLLPIQHYPVGEGSVIALLVASRPQDIQEAQIALRSLAFLKGDKDPEHLAPVLIFNEGDLPDRAIKALIESTNRPIAFPLVNFMLFPAGFNPDIEAHKFVVKGRKPWGYYQMIRFWTTMIWRHPAIQRFDAVMRLDSDSCFKEENNYLPNFMYDGLYYHSQYVGVEPEHGANFIQGMYDFAVNWMIKTKQPVEPRNTLLWHFIDSAWKTEKTLPVFRTNFELSKVALMQRGDVARFHDAITEKDPYPMLRNRWGDAVMRFLMIAIFETNDRVLTVRPTGYFHKTGCSANEVSEALKKFDDSTNFKIEEVTNEEVMRFQGEKEQNEKILANKPEPVEYSHLVDTLV